MMTYDRFKYCLGETLFLGEVGFLEYIQSSGFFIFVLVSLKSSIYMMPATWFCVDHVRSVRIIIGLHVRNYREQ